MKTFVSAKIHGIRVTDKSVDYNGSVSIDAALMRQAGIDPYEQVDVIDLENGNRWTTYALPVERKTGENPAFTLNGGGARLGEKGDRCVIITYRQSESFEGAEVIFCDAGNFVRDTMTYPAEEPEFPIKPYPERHPFCTPLPQPSELPDHPPAPDPGKTDDFSRPMRFFGLFRKRERQA